MNTDEIYAKLLAAEYAPKTSRKIIALRKLDKKAAQPAVIFAYILGVTAALIFSIGMCLLTVYFVAPIPVQLYMGLLFSAVGLLAMSLNCPLYKKTLKIESSGMRLKLLSWQKRFADMTCIR